jgi:hypothetical protein
LENFCQDRIARVGSQLQKQDGRAGLIVYGVRQGTELALLDDANCRESLGKLVTHCDSSVAGPSPAVAR